MRTFLASNLIMMSLFGDALMLSKMADGILLVVRPGVLDSAVAKSTKMMLEQTRSPVLGMVVNGVTAVSGYSYYSSKEYYQNNGNENKVGKGNYQKV